MTSGKENFPIRLPGGLKDYPRDFGNTQAEEMNRELYRQTFSFAKKVETASEFDNQRTKIDLVIFTDKPFLAVQQKFSQSRERVQAALTEILKQPLAQLHDNEGNVIYLERLPRVLVHDDLKKWGEAYNQFLAEKLASPLTALASKTEIAKKFLGQMLKCLRAEKYYFPQHSEIFDERIKVLENELARFAA